MLEKAVDGLVAVLLLVVGGAVIATLFGAETGTVTGITSFLVDIIVRVGVLVIFSVVIISVVKNLIE